ncbi:MAG TPA: DNA helicase II, partial [Sutterella sp.]|nr:DNA helicase II [Sutterella sp.]
LEQNYRSLGHILDAANALISHNEDRLGKNLWTQAGQGDKITVFRADDAGVEAEFIADEISSRQRQGTKLDEIAVLYRANAQSRLIEQTLLAHGIPYRVYGGLRFFDRAEIKHALAYLRLIENPKDDTAFLRVVNFPARGIGAKSIETLQKIAEDSGISLFEAISQMEGAARAKLAAFQDLIETMAFEFSQLPLPQLIASVIERTGLKTFYEKEKEGEERLENLAELENAAKLFLDAEGLSEPPADGDEDMPELKGLTGFLNYAALESGNLQAEEGTPAVQLMTVHSAKGLEFNTVFVSGVEEGLFPHANSCESEAGIAEERRLMYVAITRAKRKLYLTYAESRMMHGRYYDSGPSVFIKEMPDENLARINEKKRDAFTDFLNRGRLYGGENLKKSFGSFKSDTQPEGGNAPLRVKSANGFTVGEKVVHRKFGLGEVVALLGQGEDARIRIRFDGLGTKELMLSLAKLEKLN